MWILLAALLLVTYSAGTLAGPNNATTTLMTEEKLKHDILQGNVLRSRPLDRGPTLVNITLGVRHITLDEMQSMMSVSANVKLEWVDPRVSEAWQKSEVYSTVRRLHLTRQEMWLPNIALKNGLSGKGESPLEGSAAVVRPDGRVQWQPFALLEVSCRLDLRQWPFERHQCELRLGSWTHNSSELRIQNVSYVLQFPDQTGEFIVDKIVEKKEVDLELDGFDSDQGEEQSAAFDSASYTISLHREPGTYRAVVYTPATVVIILCLATFLLPPRAGEKVVLGGVNAVLICLFLIYFAHSLPVLTNQTPLIVLFYSSSLYLVCLSLVASVVVLNLARRPHAAGLPWTIKKFLTGPCGRFLLLSGYIDQIMGINHGPCSGEQEEMPVVLNEQMFPVSLPGTSSTTEIATRSVVPQQDWLLLAAAVDRALFIVYSITFLGIAVAFHV